MLAILGRGRATGAEPAAWTDPSIVDLAMKVLGMNHGYL